MKRVVPMKVFVMIHRKEKKFRHTPVFEIFLLPGPCSSLVRMLDVYISF